MTATEVAPEIEAPAPEPPAHRRAVPWGRIAGATLPPLVALLAGWAMLAYRSGAHGSQLFSPSTWARWDSGQYLRIARIGYFGSYHCASGQVPPDPPPGPLFCGNTGWFPGYPAAMRGLFALTSISIPIAGLVIAWACWYLVLVLIWRLTADARSPATRWACLFLAAFFPGQVYFAALFPISLCIAGTLACLWLVTRDTRHPVLSGALGLVTGAAAAYCYITPIAVAPALLITAALGVRGWRRLQLLLGGLGVGAGFGATLLTMHLMVGYWNGYFLSTAKYGVGAHSPFDTIGDRLQPLWETPEPGREFLTVTASQTLLTLVIVAVVILATLIRAGFRRPPAELGIARTPAPEPGGYGATRVARRRSLPARAQAAFAHRLPAKDLAIMLAAGGVWLVPYIAGGQASTYRSEAFVVLTVPLLRRLPFWLVVPILAAACWVAWRMAPNFFNAKLI